MTAIYSRGHVAGQARDGGVNKFVCHGNRPCPLSPSLRGKLRRGSNADTLPYCVVETEAPE